MKKLRLIFFMMALAATTLATAQEPILTNGLSAMIANENGYYEMGLQYALKGIEEDPNDPLAYIAAGESLHALGNDKEALEMLEKAKKHIQKEDRDLRAVIYLDEISIHKANKDTKKALQTIEKGLKELKDHPSLLMERGVLLSDSDWEKAQKDIEKASRLATDDDALHLKAALVYYTHDNLQKALDEINEAIGIDSGVSRYYLLRGLFFEELGDKENAIADYIRGAIVEDNLGGIAYGALTENRSFDDIVIAIDIIDGEKGDNSFLNNLSAKLKYELGDEVTPEMELLNMIERGTATSETFYLLSSLYENQKDFPSAIEVMEKAVEEYPDNAGMKRSLTNLYTNEGFHNSALMTVRSLLNDEPGNYENHRLMGTILLNKGDYPEGIAALLNSLNIEEYPTTRINLSFAFLLDKDDESLKENSKKILEYDPEALRNEGFVPEYFQVIAYSGLGDRDQVENTLKLLAENYMVQPNMLAMTEILMGNVDAAIEYVHEAIEEEAVDKADLIYTSFFHPLHSNEKYVEMLREYGYDVELDPETGLLREIPITHISIVDEDKVLNEVKDITELREFIDPEEEDLFVVVSPPPLIVEQRPADITPDSRVYEVVEQPAEFPGGQTALMKWLSNNVRYPEEAQQNNIQGRVIVKFVVTKEGEITDAKIVRGVDPLLDQESLRVVRKMPNWIPGKNNNIPVDSYYTLPITFRLQNDTPAGEDSGGSR